MKKNLLLFIFTIFLLTNVSAEYIPHKINNDLFYSFTSNNATECNITQANTPYGIININQITTKSGQTFNITIKSGNFTSIGTYCFNIVCSDGTQIENGDFCREVTPSGFNATLGFYLVIIGIIALVVILGFAIKEAWFVVIGGLALIMFGIYSINYGIAGFRDMFMTWGIGLFEIGIGTILSVGSAMQKLDLD